MKNRTIYWILPVLLMFVLSSCNLTAQQTPSDVEMQTMVALRVEQTQLAATLAAVQQFITPTLEPGQPTPVPPTETLTPTVTLTPEPTNTATPSGVWLTITENTNCRVGPASYYRLITSLTAGQTVEATGKNSYNDYFYVVNPDNPNGYCWVWGKYATVSGSTDILPVYTAQPTNTPTNTPTVAPGIDLDYEGLDSCSGNYYVKIRVLNTGSSTWKSIKIVIKDNDTSTTLTNASDTFTSYSGCTVSSNQKDLTQGEEGVVANYSSGKFTYDPTGHSLTITVTVYSADSRTGTSFSKSFKVTP
ncbi:MAG: hypothetical protein VB013_04830 [Anaerolineaceae bacterium]|nr:hypothetical protein [Anaerolineaceae bacterium]